MSLYVVCSFLSVLFCWKCEGNCQSNVFLTIVLLMCKISSKIQRQDIETKIFACADHPAHRVSAALVFCRAISPVPPDSLCDENMKIGIMGKRQRDAFPAPREVKSNRLKWKWGPTTRRTKSKNSRGGQLKALGGACFNLLKLLCQQDGLNPIPSHPQPPRVLILLCPLQAYNGKC